MGHAIAVTPQLNPPQVNPIPRFHWKLSYMDEVEYQVFGHPVVTLLERYRGSDHTLQSFRSIYNGDDESFARNVLSRQGGVAIRGVADHSEMPHHWTPEFYEAFVEWLALEHRNSLQELRKMYERQHVSPELQSELRQSWEPLFIPRPIYFDFECGCYKTEPWFLVPPPCEGVTRESRYGAGDAEPCGSPATVFSLRTERYECFRCHAQEVSRG